MLCRIKKKKTEKWRLMKWGRGGGSWQRSMQFCGSTSTASLTFGQTTQAPVYLISSRLCKNHYKCKFVFLKWSVFNGHLMGILVALFRLAWLRYRSPSETQGNSLCKVTLFNNFDICQWAFCYREALAKHYFSVNLEKS